MDKLQPPLWNDLPITRSTLIGRSLFCLYQWEVHFEGFPSVIVAKELLDFSMARAEWEGLNRMFAWGIPCPRPYGICNRKGKFYLLMDFVFESTNLSNGEKENALVETLLQLYKPAEHWGYPIDNFIGSIPQTNGVYASFPEFWMESRILPMLEYIERKRIPISNYPRWLKRIDRAIRIWEMELEKPYLIHGDLWNGNLIFSGKRAVLIDPSLSYSHPEQDLAMLELFGSCLGANNKNVLIGKLGICQEKARRRVPFWQVYPLLVHVAIFGSSYLGQLQSVLDDLPD